MDASEILNPLLDLAGTTVLGLVGLAITQLTTRAKRWADKQTVQDAVNTAAGSVLLKLASGAVTLQALNAQHSAVTGAADAALDRVPAAAGALGGVTAQNMAALIAGAVGNALAGDPSVPTIARAGVPSVPTKPIPVSGVIT